jgi:hypothetical protein
MALDTQHAALPLDTLNFLLADAGDGLGPDLAIYLRGVQQWSPQPSAW